MSSDSVQLSRNTSIYLSYVLSTGHSHDPDPTPTPVVPPATTTNSGLPTGGTTVGGATLGAAQILSTPAMLVPGAPWALDPFGTLQLIK